MAATVSAWAKPGAWALDSEEHEAELLHQKEEDDTAAFPSLAAAAAAAAFPSLAAAAAAAAATKPKKKKGQTISLAEFSSYGGAKPTQTSQSNVFTHEDFMMLPTGPRQRTAEELDRDRSRLGGGFRSYGSGSYDRSNRNYGGDESSNSRWGSSRVSDEPRRNGSFGREANRDMAPSRADEIDDWAAAKKSTVGSGFERRERDRGGRFFDSPSRADESDSWASKKNFVPSEGRRFGSNGGGFERERKVGFGSSGGADSDNWNRKKVESNGGNERSETGSVRPRLVLQPRSTTVNNGDQDGSGTVAKPKGSNPFGEARPREEVLAEKGQDWKKIDEQLETMKIKDTVEQDGFVKRGFGGGSGRASLPDSDRTERSWRKTESNDDLPNSAEKVENGHVEEKAENGHVEETEEL